MGVVQEGAPAGGIEFTLDDRVEKRRMVLPDVGWRWTMRDKERVDPAIAIIDAQRQADMRIIKAASFFERYLGQWAEKLGKTRPVIFDEVPEP